MMEQFTGAFLSSSVQAIFDLLASSNLTDYFRRGKLDKLVDELESTLDSINQVLDDAEIKQYQFPNVKKWLADVKHAMYEADQLLDEIATHAPLKKMRVESQPTTSSNNYFGIVSAFINPFESPIKDLLKNLKHLAEQKDVLELKNRSLVRNEFGVCSKPLERPQTSYLVDASQIYGRDDEKDEMVKFLLSNNDSGNQTPVSSIVGLGGMGKTTFAKLVYNDNRIEECFELKAWVYVSESFDVVGLTKAILKSFHSPSDDESSFNLLQERLQHVLRGKKYLLVLDDIWNGNAEYWEQLLLPFNHGSYGSKIIVTTRDNEVANVLKSTKVFYLQKLDQSNCWDLFVTHAFHGKNVNENLNLESIGKKIVEKCGGLPLAVKTMGQLLRKKFSQHEWMKILETDLWRLSDGNNNINPVLRLSYHNLPSNQKCCFAFCSIFPKGYLFRKGKLIKLWMAEGLLKCCRTEKSEEELGNEIFGDLKSISFFQQSSNLFEMHDLVNDLAKSVSGEFCMRIEEAEVEGIPDRTRHVGLSFQLDFVDKLREPICELKGLRSLILWYGWTMSISNSVQHDIFSRLRYLRMLSFRDCRLSDLVDEISNLKLLRYLDLSFTEISRLPDTICMLCNLQTLLLSECEKLTELPSNFSKLINLRHLKLPYYINKMPKNIGSLSNLQKLNYFIVEEQSGSDLKELEKLNHLRGTIQITGLGKVIDPTNVTTRSLKDKKYLKEIEIIFDDRSEDMDGDDGDGESEDMDGDDGDGGSEDMDGDDGDGGSEDMDGTIVERNAESVLEALQPNSNLQMLTISKYRGNSFPNWLNGSHLSPPEQLTSLKELSISKCHGIKIFGNDSINVPFKFLEVLRFENMKNWKEWLCMEGFPRLKELSIFNCPKLKRALPQHLPSLQILVINYCPKLKRALPQHLPSLQKLVIGYCEMLDVSVPNGNNIIDLNIQGCGRILINKLSPSLKAFALRGNQYVEFSMVHLINFPFLETLVLDIQRCGRILINELSPSLKRFVFRGNQYVEFSMDHLINCPFLETLELDLKDTVECPSLDLCCYNSLSSLRITGWKFSSLPFSLHLFTHLKSLDLSDCPGLESFPMGGFPSNLTDLYITYCPSLESLPEEGLPNSLSTLSIRDCPLLEEKYKKEGGERWHTISHIPIVWIDNVRQHLSD